MESSFLPDDSILWAVTNDAPNKRFAWPADFNSSGRVLWKNSLWIPVYGRFYALAVNRKPPYRTGRDDSDSDLWLGMVMLSKTMMKSAEVYTLKSLSTKQQGHFRLPSTGSDYLFYTYQSRGLVALADHKDHNDDLAFATDKIITTLLPHPTVPKPQVAKLLMEAQAATKAKSATPQQRRSHSPLSTPVMMLQLILPKLDNIRKFVKSDYELMIRCLDLYSLNRKLPGNRSALQSPKLTQDWRWQGPQVVRKVGFINCEPTTGHDFQTPFRSQRNTSMATHSFGTMVKTDEYDEKQPTKMGAKKKRNAIVFRSWAWQNAGRSSSLFIRMVL
ncbi:hypothetical protein N7488_000888 [Penicillium malachiteum]|nr:hypothetical protein N7488_000888 [Penicillium malachiteum]